MKFPELDLPTDDRDCFQALLASNVFFDYSKYDREKIIFSILEMGNYCRQHGYSVSYEKIPIGKNKIVAWNGTHEITNEVGYYFLATFKK